MDGAFHVLVALIDELKRVSALIADARRENRTVTDEEIDSVIDRMIAARANARAAIEEARADAAHS